MCSGLHVIPQHVKVVGVCFVCFECVLKSSLHVVLLISLIKSHLLIFVQGPHVHSALRHVHKMSKKCASDWAMLE